MDGIRRYIIVFVTVFSVVLPFFYYSSSLRTRQDLNLLEKIVLSVSQPFDALLGKIKVTFGDALHNYVVLVGAREEAAALREENARLSIRLQIASELEQENARLRELLQFADRSGEDYVSARVLSRDPSYFFDSIRINRGARDGIRSGLAVVAAGGAVGLVMRVGAATSHVLLLSDPNMSLDVIVARNRKRGVLRGLAASRMALRHASTGSSVLVGDQVMTSGLTGAFPRGVLVGQVASVDLDKDNVSQVIQVTPAVDFSGLSEVLVLRRPNPEIEVISQIGGPGWLERVMQTGEKGGQ